MNRKELKEKAKESLKGKYKETIKAFLAIILISMLIGIVASILDSVFKTTWILDTTQVMGEIVETKVGLFEEIGSIITSSLLTFGLLSYFIKISRNEEVTYKEVFTKTNLWLDFIVLTLIICVFITLWSILLIIPGIIAALSYSLVFYIKLDNPELGYIDVIKKSKELMNGHKLEYIILNLSFLGWIILGAFTLGILYIWLIPYMAVTECNFYNKLANK